MPRRPYLLTALAVVVLVLCASAWYTSRPALPPEIRIASGQPGGLYHAFSRDLARRLHERTGRPVCVVETAGSEANLRLLRDGEVELALIQTTSLTPEGVVGVAPLFPELLHFLVPKGSDIRSPADLAGRRVVLGLRGSGIRQNANTLLPHYGISPEVVRDVEDPFGALTGDGADAALVTTGWMNPTLEKILLAGQVKLVGLADPEGVAARYPWFTPATIPRGLYSGHPLVPPEPVRTVAVTALLATRADATDELVGASLATLYETDLRAAYPVVMSAKAARDYDAAVMHPAVAGYHDPSAQLNRLAQLVELASKFKEVLFGAAAATVVAWGWVRRRRELRAFAEDHAQKQKLDEFIKRTLAVEVDQMEVTDPEQLRPYLRQVTLIKQEALQELTSEKVRGDQLFAIFLSQCAALSEKIQMRMIYGSVSETGSVTGGSDR
ncbi:MAG TPA: TAXI family TRAP transporter solute-binding subunit [Fimbriiglobus sp.]|jgi:TRAP transporter TAXI family solute receptor|nr:TAXI family TRAP transporter solute-binding subunit [Fimbriiglobus sp.]